MSLSVPHTVSPSYEALVRSQVFTLYASLSNNPQLTPVLTTSSISLTTSNGTTLGRSFFLSHTTTSPAPFSTPSSYHSSLSSKAAKQQFYANPNPTTQYPTQPLLAPPPMY